jgi:hypothetical protein
MFAYSPWGPIPVVIIRNDPAAGLNGGTEAKGTIAEPQSHRLPLRQGHSVNSSGPMADREPVSFARVHFLQEPARGFVPTLLSVASAFHKQKPIDGKNPCQNQDGADPYRNRVSPRV